MHIRWVTVFVDRPASGFDEVREFWRRVTDATMSPTRGARDEFATFVPPDGDAYFKIQRVQDGPGGSHLDLHVDDPRAAADAAIELGATELADLGTVVVLRSPGGVVFCTVPVRVAGVRPAPAGPQGRRTIIDQVSIDLAPERYDAEQTFWSDLTGWAPVGARVDSFSALHRPPGIPVRFMFQRCGDDRAGHDAGVHLDLSCDDRAATIGEHERWGATQIADHPYWTVMCDPAGHEYCLTVRNPDTGLL